MSYTIMKAPLSKVKEQFLLLTFIVKRFHNLMYVKVLQIKDQYKANDCENYFCTCINSKRRTKIFLASHQQQRK